jgi:oxygen-dependent protoporphyrinogen oxidase
MMKEVEVVIIGAGLTGLTTAFYLNKAGINFQVIEKIDRPGGVISTLSENGFIYENGPNTGVVGTAEVIDLFNDLNGLCEIEIANSNVNKRFILKNGKWEKLPSGLIEGIKTPLFSTKDKFRILTEPFRKRGKNPHETLSELVLRRLGKSILEYAIDPFILGVYAGDPNYLVPKYALPKLYNLEQNFGSFIGGSIKKGFQKKDEQAKKITRKVFSAKGGLSNLTNALFQAVGQDQFTFNTTDTAIRKENEFYVLKGKNSDGNFEIKTKQLISTISVHSLKGIFPFIENSELDKISNLKYAKVIEVVLGFDKWKGIPLDGFGGLIPHKENRQVLGYLFLSSFFENRAPREGAMLTIFMGGVRNEAIFDLPDEKIKQIVEKETKELMQVPEFNPVLFKINRYEHAIPQYGIESGTRFDTIEKLQKMHPGLIIGGNNRNGIGMADRIKQGKEMAEQAVRNLSAK